MEDSIGQQQYGDYFFDQYDREPPKGVRVYDPDRSEIAQQVEVVEGALAIVERAALQLRHVVLGEQARQDTGQACAEKFFGPFAEHPMPSHRSPAAPE